MKVHSELKGNDLRPAYAKPTKARFGILILLFLLPLLIILIEPVYPLLHLRFSLHCN